MDLWSPGGVHVESVGEGKVQVSHNNHNYISTSKRTEFTVRLESIPHCATQCACLYSSNYPQLASYQHPIHVSLEHSERAV